ncbi:MAG: hypothetical protein AABX33_04930 [Nanoarchaeota archaeon]
MPTIVSMFNKDKKKISLAVIIATVFAVTATVFAIVEVTLLFVELSNLDKATSPTSQKLQQTETKEITIYIDKFPYGVDKKYENSIREATSFYEKISNGSVSFKEILTIGEADVYVKWFKEFGTGALGHTVNQKGITTLARTPPKSFWNRKMAR